MKQKLSVSLDKATLDKVEALIEDSIFRDKSHVVEIAISKLVKDNLYDERHSNR